MNDASIELFHVVTVLERPGGSSTMIAVPISEIEQDLERKQSLDRLASNSRVSQHSDRYVMYRLETGRLAGGQFR